MDGVRSLGLLSSAEEATAARARARPPNPFAGKQKKPPTSRLLQLKARKNVGGCDRDIDKMKTDFKVRSFPNSS